MYTKILMEKQPIILEKKKVEQVSVLNKNVDEYKPYNNSMCICIIMIVVVVLLGGFVCYRCTKNKIKSVDATIM